MIIYYAEEFKNVLKEPSRNLKISNFKLGSTKTVSNIKDVETLWKTDSSPTIGYYDLEGIYENSKLTLSISIPDYDVSGRDMDSYRILYILYEDLNFTTSLEEKYKLAFILSGDISKNNEEGIIEFGSLYLEPKRTIITVENFLSNCSLVINQDSDFDFLEGLGLSKPGSLYIDESKINNLMNTRYVSLSSYETYLHEVRNQDDYKHLDTVFINKYGLKIY